MRGGIYTYFAGNEGVPGRALGGENEHSLYYSIMKAFDSERLKKFGAAGFLFFLLKGLVWLLLFLFAWSEV